MFCPHCGTNLEIETGKFCTECGGSLSGSVKESSLQVQNQEVQPNTPQNVISPDLDNETENPAIASSINQLGKKLEEAVEKLFRAEGYQTCRNTHFGDKSSRRFEIDVIAQKNSENIAIECKNYSKAVGIEKVNHFSEKLKWITQETNQPWRGIFIAYSNLSNDAENVAAENNIETWGRDIIVEKWAQFSFGRLMQKGEILKLESALSLNTDYTKATSLHLKNKKIITISDAILTFHPYLKLNYHFSAKYTDPAKETHRFQDKGIIIVDMLDGTVLNPEIIRDIISGLSKAFNILSASKKHEENKRSMKIIHELETTQASLEYRLNIGQDYRVSKLNRVIPIRSGIANALDYIIERNTQIIKYRIQRRDSFEEFKEIEFIPKKNTITIISRDIISVPKWTIHFNSLGHIYTRELLAHSGELLEDTIQYCPNHRSFGILTETFKNKPKTIAVCEECGKAFCKDHINECPICGKWYCQEHSNECNSCKGKFCKEHTPYTSDLNNLPLCEECIRQCSICKKIVGSNNLHICDKCGLAVCESCIKKSGILSKSKICLKCLGK